MISEMMQRSKKKLKNWAIRQQPRRKFSDTDNFRRSSRGKGEMRNLVEDVPSRDGKVL